MANGNGSLARVARNYGRRRAAGDAAIDPASKTPQAPPNFGRYSIPQIVTFQGRLSTVANIYKNPDAAIQDSIDNARMMRKSLVIEECLEARKLATTLLNWHLEVDEEDIDKDSEQAKLLVSTITSIIRRMPRFAMYRFSLMDAIWLGREGNQHRYSIRHRKGKKRVEIAQWSPIHGDKFAFRWDDGSGKHDPNEIGIRVGPTFYLGDEIAGNRKIEITDYGPAYFLEPWERRMVCLHRHIIEDGFYEDPMSAGRVHGVGIRDRVYWTWFQMQETLGYLMEVTERTGSGFYVYYFEKENDKSYQKMKAVASDQAKDNYILLPRTSGDGAIQDAEGIDMIPPNTAGIDALEKIVHEYFGHQIKRYILGQTLTSEAQATGLGSNVADMHYESLMRIRDFDALNLDETLTLELVETIKNYNLHLFPWAQDITVRYKTDTDSTESDKKLEAAYRAWEMGAKIKTSDIFELCGLSAPSPEDDVLFNPQIQQQQRLWDTTHDADGNPITGPTEGGQAPEGSPEDLFGPLADGSEGGEQVEPGAPQPEAQEAGAV